MGAELAGISVAVMSLCSYPTTMFSVILSVQYTLALSLHLLGRVFSQSRNYDIMELSDLAKGGLESGAWIDEYKYQKQRQK